MNSTMKKVREAAMLPTNLHINDIIIRRRTTLNNYDLNTLFRRDSRPLRCRIASSPAGTRLLDALLRHAKRVLLQVQLWRGSTTRC